VNPQLTIMALATRLAFRLLQSELAPASQQPAKEASACPS
jgi:choline dehydrogenase-like flavoprotein